MLQFMPMLWYPQDAESGQPGSQLANSIG